MPLGEIKQIPAYFYFLTVQKASLHFRVYRNMTKADMLLAIRRLKKYFKSIELRMPPLRSGCLIEEVLDAYLHAYLKKVGAGNGIVDQERLKSYLTCVLPELQLLHAGELSPERIKEVDEAIMYYQEIMINNMLLMPPLCIEIVNDWRCAAGYE